MTVWYLRSCAAAIFCIVLHILTQIKKKFTLERTDLFTEMYISL